MDEWEVVIGLVSGMSTYGWSIEGVGLLVNGRGK